MIASLVLLGYAIAFLVIGAIVSRSVRACDFYVAGRSLGPGLLFSTLLAANIGAGSTVGAAGLAYRDGLSAWWWVGSAGIGSLVLAFTVAPRIWRVARDQGLYTVGDYLEFRYSRGARELAAWLLWIGSLSILAGQVIAMAWILNVTLGLGKPLGCLIGSSVATLYFTAGGLHSSARVNVLQLIVKLTGFALALAYFWCAGDGLHYLRELTAGEHSPGISGLAGAGVPAVLRYLPVLAPAFIVSPGILQKVFGGNSLRTVRTGVGLNAAGLIVFAIVPVLLGAVARGQFPALENSELALPMLLMNSLPSWIGGLLLGAILSAELSAADAVLFMLTTSLSRDLYQTRLQPHPGERQLLRFTRCMAVLCGVLGALLGILIPGIISALTIFYTLLTTALFLPVIAGLYSSRVTSRAALATMIVSVVITFAVEFFVQGGGWSGLPSPMLGMTAGALVMILITAVEPRRANDT